ncbi:allatostatin-A receptor-like [Littorina saxatilis]|uniref:allatostatin-A receptor-like n=1 Tax=Littorina saxatilis TaxID=31220 RepID=UPI0038B439C7
MVFLLNEDNMSSIMNHTGFLTTATTLPWADSSHDHNFSVNHSDMTTVVKLDAEVQQLVTKATLDKVTFAFGMVLIPLFAIFGVVGNILSLVVLVQHRMRSTTNVCLAALAVSDLLLLLHSLTFSAMRIHSLQDPLGALRVRRTTYPVLGAYGSIVCARITTWLTTMLGVERCIAVYFPMKAKSINSRRSTLLAIVSIYLLTAVAFLPTALQYRVVQIRLPRNITLPKLELSTLGRNQNFMVPYGLVLNIIFRFVPLAVLMIVNVLIAVAIRRTQALRRNMSWSSGVAGGRGHGSGHEQTRITLMLLTVSVVFLVCTLPGALNTIVSRCTANYSRLGAEGNLYHALAIVTYFLETLNSSVNFVIYMAFSRKFCHIYQEIFCCRNSPWQPWPMSLHTVRFAPRGPSSTSLHSSHEMHCRQYRPLPKPLFPTSSGAQRVRLLNNGYTRQSLDMDDVNLINGNVPNRSPASANGNLPVHGACCTCHQANKAHSHSRSRSQSRSHSSDSAAQQYS